MKKKQIKPVFYNLKNDIVFKTFFSRKGNEEFLIDFLNALLKVEIVKIEIQEEVSIEQLSKQEKGGRLDLQATLNDGVIVNIELQMRDEHNIKERTSLYASKVISRETKRGTEYEDIKKVIMINILGYNIFEYEEYISKTAIVLDEHREYEVMDNLQWYFIELPKFREQNPDMSDKLNQWLAFLDGERKELVEMAEKNNETLQRAREEMNYLEGDEAVRRLVELREKWDMDYNSGISYAKKEGIKEGIKETAKKMLAKNIDIKDIMEITGLTKEEIENLK